jgi:hypothetical protein
MKPENMLWRLARRGASFEECCNKLEMSPAATRAILDQMRVDGHAIDIAGEKVAVRPAAVRHEVVNIAIQKSGDSHVFAVATDLHFGSKYHLRGHLLEFISHVWRNGVRIIFLPGDLLDGCYHHGRWELTHHGFQDQAQDFCEGLPQLPGLKYYAITGNHDETFEKDSGMVVHRALADLFHNRGRTDLSLLGARGATVCLKGRGEKRGLLVEMWHPLKGPAYALSYKLQKKIEGYAPGSKPDVLLTGHWHQSCYVHERGVHALSCGTFQGGGSAFGRALGGSPSIGGWMFKYALTADGTVREFSPMWRGYFENEVPRAVVI